MQGEILFNGKEHRDAYYACLDNFGISPSDIDRRTLIYLLTITEDCRKHILDCYDPAERLIKKDALCHPWVTSSDARAIRLALCTFTGGAPTALKGDGDDYDIGELIRCTPYNIFDYGGINNFLLEGLRMRFAE